jgi:hypothetical protein
VLVGSGLIYAAIIVMWAAYFIPRWLRRHEELSESRSVEKFDRAMRILSRREPTPDRRYVVMPPRPVPAQRARTTRTTRPVRRSVAIRRRRVLAGLLLTTLVTSVAAPLSPVPWWAPLAGLGLVIAYLVHLRLQARSTRELTRTRAAVRKRSRSRLMRFDTVERLMTVRRELAGSVPPRSAAGRRPRRPSSGCGRKSRSGAARPRRSGARSPCLSPPTSASPWPHGAPPLST